MKAEEIRYRYAGENVTLIWPRGDPGDSRLEPGEYWSTGVMECWSAGVMEKLSPEPRRDSLRHFYDSSFIRERIP